MSFTTAAKNVMLDAIAGVTVSLHTDYPGTTGVNEVSGGAPAYARKAATFAAASGGTKSTSAGLTFDVPACTVRWVGLWVGGTFYGASPNGGTPAEFVADVTNDKILKASHGYANGQKLVFYAGTPPTGLTAGTIYYVVNASTNDFQVSASSGGAAVNITGLGATDCQLSPITEQVYAAQGTHTISAGNCTLGLPF